jgi:adenylate cyclase
VAPEVAELLLAEASNLEQIGKIEEVTVLFADIRNFTSLVQHLRLDRLRAFLNEFFTLFTDIIYRHQGTVDKFMGDAVLSLFGAPVALENSCLAAAKTALLIREGFAELRYRWAAEHKDFLTVDLGMGITHGEMFVGNVGSSSRLDFTVIGTQVNIAQRLAAESSSCEIFLTDEVRLRLADTFPIIERGCIPLRGVEQQVVVSSLA